MKTTTFRGHAATFARLFCLKSLRVRCFRRRRRRRRWRARSRRHRRTRHSKHIFFSRCCVIQNFLCVVTKICLISKQKKQNKSEFRKKRKKQTHDKKRICLPKKNTKKARPERPPHNKDLKVFISSEEGREGHLISSLSVLVVISNDAQPVVCNRKEEKAEERKRRRC